MARFHYRLVDVFTTAPFRGNALAVFPAAEGIEEGLMQRIAAELNLSETTFVLPTTEPGCDFRLRIFTPAVELPMAGHPTVGTAWVLDHGARVVFLEGVGPIRVDRGQGAGGETLWWMSQLPPTWVAREERREQVAAALGLAPADLVPDLPLEVVSCGLPFLLVPLRDLEALARAAPNPPRWKDLGADLAADAAYCFTTATGEGGVDVRSRMFAPAYGVGEDAATGSASGPLGCYLVHHDLVRGGAPARLRNVQGVEMGRRSEIHIEIEGRAAAIEAVRVGGASVPIGAGVIEVAG